MRALRAGQGQAEADPFFSVDGHSNKANLNNPVEVAYGRNRLWPSYICQPYRTYKDDILTGWSDTAYTKNTSLVQIFCLGQGSFDIHSVQVGDVLLESHRGMRYEIVQPGQSSVSLARIMYVQPDFKPIILSVGLSTDVFTMSPSGTKTNRFEIDAETSSDDSYVLNVNQYEVDDSGAVLTLTPAITTVLTRPAGTDTNSPPHRHTFSFVSGSSTKRYAFKIQLTAHYSGTVTILELRSFTNPTIPLGYSDKTLLVVNYFVTDLDSEDISSDKINVIATRKLKTINIAGTNRIEIVQPTRSIPWAFYDALTNTTYGGGLPETFIDVEALSELHGEFEKQEITFDYVFNQGTTVEDAAKAIAAAGRCSLAYNGSKLTLIRDYCQGPPEALFSTENIIKDSFSWSSEMFDPTEPDAVEASYVETDSGQEHTTLFMPEGSLGNNVQKLSILGVNSKKAWGEAAHKMRRLQLIRDTFKFKTGMEGYIPSIGATAMLSWDMESFGESGYVEEQAGGWLVLSRNISVATGDVRAMLVLRRDDGSTMGPYQVLEVDSDDGSGKYRAVLISEIDFDVDFFRTDKEPIHFVSWPGSDYSPPITTKIQIEKVEPSDDGTISITATNYDPKIYEFDSVTPPANEYVPVDPTSVVPFIRDLFVDSVKTPLTSTGLPYTRIRWAGSFGMHSYRLYINGSNVWEGTANYLERPLLEYGDYSIKVVPLYYSGLALTEGTSSTGVVDVTTSPILINPGINASNYRFDDDGLTFWWDSVIAADAYEIRIEAGISGSPVLSPWYGTEATAFKYTKTMFKQDFGDLLITSVTIPLSLQARAIIGGVETSISTIDVTLTASSGPTNVTVVQDSAVIVGLTFTRLRTINWERASTTDAAKGTMYRIYMQAYINGVDSSTLSIKPWVRMATTDKCTFTTNTPVPEVQTFDKDVFPLNEIIDDIYGQGYRVQIGFSSSGFLINVGEQVDNGAFIYHSGSENAGKFHPFTKMGTTQSDGIIWLAKALLAEVTGAKAAIVFPHRRADIGGGSDWRVKGAIIADNGWFMSSAAGTATFDVDA